MKILMLGWEYPPHISGGLGTACQGLTTALASQGVEIDFVVPTLYGDEDAPHMRLRGAQSGELIQAQRVVRVAGHAESSQGSVQEGSAEDGSVRVVSVPAMLKPYLDEAAYDELVETVGRGEFQDWMTDRSALVDYVEELPFEADDEQGGGVHYGDDLFKEVARYATSVSRRVDAAQYDLVHAHDWMTFVAGTAIAKRAGKPLLLHVHSLEYDRAAHGSNPGIVDIEREGFDAATKIIAVSYYTRRLINQIHGTPLEKIDVVHNGVYAPETVQAYTEQRRSSGPVVLFLGRITFQKGPEYFVQAAARVLEHVPDAVFVLAGSGDMLPRMMQMVDDLGIQESFRFPGFVRGAELERTFSTADVYVMPSVSEPFGIAPLEAMAYDRPVIVSKQSGVSEVLKHALKVDFWDVDQIANQIIALLEFPELRDVIVARAREEVRTIHWEAAAQKLVPIYETVMREGRV